jgi:pimeloyl-ACP methyl ester carboxylesterase
VLHFFALCLLFFPLAADAEEQFFDSHGVTIHYVEAGQGEPVVLLHGFTGNIERYWVTSDVLPTLAKDYRVIAIDCRGHGQSGKPHEIQQYGLEIIEDVVRLLDHLQIPKAHMVGYSMGAHIATKLLTMHPERILTVTVGGAAGRIRGADDDQFSDEAAASLEQGKGVVPILRRLSNPDQPPPTEEQLQELSQRVLTNNDVLALAAVMRSTRAWKLEEAQIRASRIPILAIVGSRDSSQTEAQLFKTWLPSVEVVRIEGAVHTDAYRRPEFRASLLTFLQAHKQQEL